MFTLTRGSLKKILESISVTDPIMQIVQMKQIQNNMDGMTRYKVTLFDGETQHTFGILATQKNHLVENGELKIGSVIKLEEYAANVLSKDPPKVVIILLNFEVLGEMDPDMKPTISAPVTTSISNSSANHNENVEPKKEPKQPMSGMKGGNMDSNSSASAKNFFNKDASLAKSVVNATNPSSSAGNNGMFNNQKIFGISSLNPYQNKWSIKVRVTNKSAIRTYSNAKGEGKVFSVDFIDNTGEIKANGFNEQCDKFYELLQLDHVYYVSRATLKTANKQYSKLDNDYEMTFGNETVIEPCNESSDNIPHMNLNIIKISDIQHKQANEFIDLISVVKSAGDVTTIVTKQTNKELKKRELQLVDDSNYSITCTLWGKQAEDFEPSHGLVILLKGAKVGDYNGKTLSVATTTQVQLNPDTDESFKLRSWFDNGGADCEMHDLSSMGGSGSQSGMSGAGGQMGGAGAGNSSWKYLDQLKEERLGMNDKADYFTSKAYVLYARKDNSMYMACPGENCNKKVIDQNDGTFRCEKCAKNYTEFNWRIILSLNIADFSDNNWVTCFQESAETILGHSAQDLGRMKDENGAAYDEIFTNCVFQEYNFRLRAKMETYNDEKRVKVSVVSAEPIDYAASGRRLLQKIKEFAKSQI